jgi:predicted RNA-binding protein YlqC (UPF0109 family)
MSEEPLPMSAGLALERASSLLVYITRSLVRDGKEQVIVRHGPADRSPVQLSVTVPTEELGKVIGRGGRTANAIRTLVAAMAASSGVNTQVEFSDGKKPNRRPSGRGPQRRNGGRRDDRPRRS